MADKSAPASGEQGAISGYFVQYEFSASTLYHLLQENLLEGISICDHSAGLCDDLVVFSGQDLIAHQIKSEGYAQAFRLRTELLERKLITEIASSWTSLREEYPGKNVCIRYVFGGFPSVSDKKDFDDVGHSAELFAYLGDREREHSKEELLSSRWAPFIRELITASELSEGQFFQMFLNLKLFDRQEIVRRQISSLDRYGRKRATDIKHLLPTIVAERTEKKFWSEDDLIDKLGWTRTAGPRALHTFPLRPDVQVNPAVEDRLRRAIDRHTSGYISLLGPPGTGKSTTLQRAIGSTPEHGVARYLAFLPDERHGLGRAEAADFLNDITLGLSRLGFSRPRFAEDRELRQEFQDQLQEAHELYESSKRKTLIIVDGLDHIHREERPQHSLLGILPLPTSVPDGVLFILGTQFLELDGIAPSIAQQASAADRRVEMEPLPKHAIYDMAEKAGVPEHVDRQALYDVCAGHPLVARYYIGKLLETGDEADAESLLSSGAIGTDIEQMYERVWNSLDPDEHAKHVLALLARADNTISPNELASVVNDAAVNIVRKKAGFLLEGGAEGNWSIFHNSFRLFIGNRTRKRFGHDDPSIDVALYTELAGVARRAESDSGQRWLELRYLARAGDKGPIKALATPERFRKELREFRGGKDVYIDLRLAYDAIESKAELAKFMQLMLAEKEVDYRLEAISQLDLVKVHLNFEEQDVAFKIALSSAERNDGTYLLIDELYWQGDAMRSRQLFEAIEPVEQFFGRRRQALLGAERKDLFDWAERAHRFRTLENILEIISGLSFSDDFRRDPTDNLKFVAARGIVFDDPTNDTEELGRLLGLSSSATESLNIQALLRLHEMGNSEQVQNVLNWLHERVEHIGQAASWVSARIAFERGDTGLARSFLQRVRVRTSKRFGDYDYRKELGGLFAATFSVARLSEHLEVDLNYELSDGEDFQRRMVENVILLGRLQAKLEKAEDPKNVLSTKQDLISTCLMLAFLEPENKLHSWDPIVGDGLSWYASTIVRLASLHSRDTLRDVEAQVEQLYVRGDNRVSRFSPFRLTFGKEVYFADGDRSKAIRRVMYLSDLIEGEYTPHQAVESRVDLACVLADIGAIKEAKTELARIHDDTLGYWLAAKKEPQYLFWNEAFERACAASPDRVNEFAAQFARFVIGLSESEGRDTGGRIVYGLLKNAVGAPGQCAGIVSRLIGTGLAGWGQIVAAILHGISVACPDLAHHCFCLFHRLVIPFSGQYVENAIGRIYGLLPSHLRKEAENDFVECALLFADTSDRASLLSKLCDVAGVPSERLEKAAKFAERELAEIREEGRSKRSSSTTDDRQEIFGQARSLSELIDAGNGSSEYNANDVDYLYARRATELVGSASVDEIKEFLNKREILKSDGKFVIEVASRFFDLDARADAEAFYNLAENVARKGNWSSWLGGEKIAFEKLRRKRGGDIPESEGFSALVADFARGEASADMVLPDLDDIFDLIAPDADWENIWLAVQAHLAEYREYRIPAPVQSFSEIGSYEELVGFLFRIGFSLSCHALTDRLREALLEIASRADGRDLFDVIARVLYAEPICHRELSAILWKLVHLPDYKDLLIKYAGMLCDSKDAIVSYDARNTLHRLGVEFEIPREELTKFYELSVVGDENADKFELPAGVEPGSEFWIDDPWYWTMVLGYEINMVSDASGIQVEAIRRRCADFMRRAGGEAAFGPSAEKELASALRSLDLRFSYARLMPQAAIKALGVVIEELTRARHIDRRVIQQIWSDLGGVHYASYELPLQPRPKEISPAQLPKMDHWQIDAEAWLSLGTERSVIPVFDDWFVLAEHSEFVFVGSWMKHTTTRTSLPDIDWKADPDKRLFGMPMIVDLNHLNTVIKKREGSTLCTVQDGLYGELRDPTLTISPNVMRELGWVRSPLRPFEILSESNEVMIKTVRWSDGIGYPEHSFTERSGKGHIVLISSNALDVIETGFGTVGISTRVIQRVESDDGGRERTFWNGIEKDAPTGTPQ